MRDEKYNVFASYHPAVNLLYFVLVLGITMFSQHPVILIISFLGAVFYDSVLQGIKKVVKFNLIFTLPMMIIVAFVNPAFNHYGVTPLFYLKTGPVTLEALIYGIVLACTLFITILWFSCYNEVMTTDKFVYLFGRIIPSLSLVLSMALRFVPRFIQQIEVIRNGQKCVGRDIKNVGFIKKVKYGIKLISILVTWSLENAIETSDSMRARGYGLRGRTAFSIYRIDKRDKIMLCVFGVLLLVFFYGAKAGYTKALYDPVIRISGLQISIGTLSTWISFGLICFIPTILECCDRIKWKRLSMKVNDEREVPAYLYTLSQSYGEGESLDDEEQKYNRR